MLLTAAAFDQSVSLLFVDNGVMHLKKGQQVESLGLKDIASIYEALAVYDVSQLFVEVESLVTLGLDIDDLLLPVQVIANDQINDLLKRHDLIVSD